ncbi:MAG: hypothetical protein WD793_08950 [Steroidobacteraceae bacterium]
MDAHVHFHDAMRVAPTLDAAAMNLKAAGRRADGLLGVLLLTQAKTERVFEMLLDSPHAGDWQAGPASAESETLIARRGTESIAVVCGRQLRTAEGLEVLALGTRERFPDGLPLADAIASVQDSGAISVLPWGFGKWLGARGRQIENAFSSGAPERLFAGDNGGRIGSLPMPRLIRRAAARGFHVLPGSDPFPFAGDHRRVGAFGFLARTELPESAPWRALRRWLLGSTGSPLPYGRGCNPLRFALNQVGIQLHRRWQRGAA